MTDPTKNLARAIEHIARAEAATNRTSASSSASVNANANANASGVSTPSKRGAAPSKREVDAIYDDLIARLADTLATLSSDDVDTTPRSFRAGSIRPLPRA